MNETSAWEELTFRVDRTKTFEPEKFLGEGHGFWPGFTEDSRILSVTELKLSDISFESYVAPGEIDISGEEKLLRERKAEVLSFDAKVIQDLYEEPHQKTLNLLHDKIGITWIEALGTLLIRPDGFWAVVSVCSYGDSSWRRHCFRLQDSRRKTNMSASIRIK